MKQVYNKPAAEIVELVVEDVLKNSTDFDGDWSPLSKTKEKVFADKGITE